MESQVWTTVPWFFFPGVLMLSPYLYLTFTYTNYYYLPAYPKIWKHIHRDEGRVKRINRGLKRSKRRTNKWLCPVHSTPTVPTVLTYSIIRSLCVWRSGKSAWVCSLLLLYGFQGLNSGCLALDKCLYLLGHFATLPLVSKRLTLWLGVVLNM